jgi:hemerythrin
MIKWDPSLSVGVEMIDGQHQELIRRIHLLVQSIKEGKCRATIGGTVDYLMDYVREHFGAEEKVMRDAGYDGYVAHHGQHEEFIRSVGQLRADLDKIQTEGGSSYELSVTTNQVVVEWVLHHIMTTDQALGRFLNASTPG